MKAHVFCVGLGVALVFGLCLAASPGTAGEQVENGQAGLSAEQLVEAALKAEASAQPDRRSELLRQAIEQDPEYPPARWYAGYVRDGGQWLTVEEMTRRASADERLAQYRELRDVQAGTPAGELALARWCRKKGLEAEERFHWLRLLQFSPLHEEALENLGMRWESGRLVTADQIGQSKQQRAEAVERRRAYRRDWKRWQKRWEPLVLKWQRAAGQGSAAFEESMREELDRVDRPVALESLDSILWERSGSEKEQEQYRTVGLKWVELLDAGPEPWSTQSLVRNAVFHPILEVRDAAADALGHRPLENFVPVLIAHMQSPVEASFAIVSYPDGGTSYRHTLYRERPDADHRLVRYEGRYVADNAGIILPNSSGASDPSRLVWEQGLRRRATAITARETLWAEFVLASMAAATQAEVQAGNAATVRLNDRIQHTLRRATGADLGEDPKQWWAWWRNWWYDQYELRSPYEEDRTEAPRQQPVYEQEFSRFSTSPGRGCVCFAPGTKVWTKTGPMPIEQVRPGDHVLSQDPASGELTYKPVVEATTSLPTPMINVELGSETITATRGHWFWVSGKGWRMAKQLAAGSPLHGACGAVSVDRLDEIPASEPWEGRTHNLIVADFHTYFAGEQKVLVHDGTFFGRPTGWVPGLDR